MIVYSNKGEREVVVLSANKVSSEMLGKMHNAFHKFSSAL